MADVDEKTKKARAERREKLLAWYEEKDLPPVIGDYELRIIDEQHDRIYYAFGWFHKSNGWKIRVLYDEETADYMVKMDLHMITLTEIECITGDLEEFKRLVKLLTPEAIEKELIHREKVSILVEGKGFMVWDYEELLPEKLGHYVRVIAPKMPHAGHRVGGRQPRLTPWGSSLSRVTPTQEFVTASTTARAAPFRVEPGIAGSLWPLTVILYRSRTTFFAFRPKSSVRA